MRMLARNMRTISYKTYVSKTVITDSDGNETGEYAITYSALKTLKANVTQANGSTFKDYYGTNIKYDREIITKNTTDIDENSLIWIDNSTSADNDYEVVKVSKSLNFTRIAIRKVK